jgi:hypothetical protein
VQSRCWRSRVEGSLLGLGGQSRHSPSALCTFTIQIHIHLRTACPIRKGLQSSRYLYNMVKGAFTPANKAKGSQGGRIGNKDLWSVGMWWGA